MRITFDEKIQYKNIRTNNNAWFDDPECVMEIKTPVGSDENLHTSLIRVQQSRFSKYCRGINLTTKHDVV